jgi:hypothetical protein
MERVFQKLILNIIALSQLHMILGSFKKKLK